MSLKITIRWRTWETHHENFDAMHCAVSSLWWRFWWCLCRCLLGRGRCYFSSSFHDLTQVPPRVPNSSPPVDVCMSGNLCTKRFALSNQEPESNSHSDFNHTSPTHFHQKYTKRVPYMSFTRSLRNFCQEYGKGVFIRRCPL